MVHMNADQQESSDDYKSGWLGCEALLREIGVILPGQTWWWMKAAPHAITLLTQKVDTMSSELHDLVGKLVPDVEAIMPALVALADRVHAMDDRLHALEAATTVDPADVQALTAAQTALHGAVDQINQIAAPATPPAPVEPPVVTGNPPTQ